MNNLTRLSSLIAILNLTISSLTYATECQTYEYVNTEVNKGNIDVEAALSSPRSRDSFKSRIYSPEPDGIVFRVYNGHTSPIVVEVTFTSGNIYLLQTTFQPQQSESIILYPQKKNLAATERFTWKPMEVKCAELKKDRDVPKTDWFRMCLGYETEPRMTKDAVAAKAAYCREAAKQPTWLQKQLWRNF